MAERNEKHVFWKALVFTIVVFGVGLVLGFFLESHRADVISSNLAKSEINLLDEQLRVRALSDFDISCGDSVSSIFDFADSVYWEARQLEEYGRSSQLSDSFLILHRRYDLLRALIWLESVEIKKKCGGDFHTLVYLYKYDISDVQLNSKQIFMSRLLLDLKNAYPDEVLLIPIAVNTNLSSVDMIVSSHGVKDFPTVIVDGKKVDSDNLTLNELKNIVFENDN